MAEPKASPWSQAKAKWLRFWHSENSKVAAARDILVAGAVVLVLLGGIWLYTGQPFPKQAPLVVVESGSMMHGPEGPCLGGGRGCSTFGDPAFSRVGTIDPGDLVLVKDVDDVGDIETAFGSGGRDGYGAHGDVIVYKRPTAPGTKSTPVIHRSMLLIMAVPEGCQPGSLPANGGCTYKIPETCSDRFGDFVKGGGGSVDWRAYCEGSSAPITMELERDGVFLSLTSYPCAASCPRFYSGFITKGDNNDKQDQPSSYPGETASGGVIACCPIRMEWIVGKARGEIPWFGLIKLGLYGNANYGCRTGQECSDPTGESQWTILRATAPWDIWTALFICIGVLVAAPMAFDAGMTRWRARRDVKTPPKRRLN